MGTLITISIIVLALVFVLVIFTMIRIRKDHKKEFKFDEPCLCEERKKTDESH